MHTTFESRSPSVSLKSETRKTSPVAENNRRYRCIMMKRSNINFAPKPDMKSAANTRSRLQRLVTSCQDYYEGPMHSPSDLSLDLDFVEEDNESEMSTP